MVVKDQIVCWTDLWGELEEAEDSHDERVNAREAKRRRDENRAGRRRDRAIQRTERSRE